MKTRLQNALIIGILSLSLAIYPAQGQGQPNQPGSIANKLPVTQNWMMEANQEYANAGYSVATAGDVNGDGFSDVIVGAPQFDNELAGEGRAYVYYGSISGLGTIPAWTGEGNEVGASFGYSVSTAGDVNGDGFSDILVGTSLNKVYAFYGSASGLNTSYDWLASGDGSGAFGYAVSSAGDVNGDGYSDVIIGAPYYNGYAGRVYIYLGSDTGLVPAYDYYQEGEAYAQLGLSVNLAGDVNGDGYSDVIAGGNTHDNDRGFASVVYGSPSGPGAAPDWVMTGPQAGEGFGNSVSTAGDVNGDGYADILVGSDMWDGGQTNEGTVRVFLGSATGLPDSPDWQAELDMEYAHFGWSVHTAGDVNGDGFADVILGAYQYDNEQFNEGLALVYYGSATGLGDAPVWTKEINQDFAQFGYSVSTAGDVNGDGLSDIIVGANLLDNGQADEGGAFVYHGSVDAPSQTANWTVDSDQAGAWLTAAGGGVGDVNGDGYQDVMVAAGKYDTATLADAGKAWLYNGSASGLEDTASWSAEGTQINGQFGSNAWPAGDVNGDGYGDVLMTTAYDNPEVDEGVAFLYLGSATGLNTSPAWSAETDQAGAGIYAIYAGDVNGDGYGDVLASSALYNNPEVDEGKVWLYLGSTTGLSTTSSWSYELDQAGATLVGVSAGDVNRDGYSDLLLGASSYDNGTIDEGMVWVFYGSASGPGSSPVWSYDSGQINGLLGMALSTAGDVNGDGYADILVGANLSLGQSNEGASLVFYGTPTIPVGPVWISQSDQGEACMGRTGSTAGDVNGDGYSDVLVAAHCFDDDQSNEGRAYLYLGSATGLATTPAWTTDGNQDTAFYAINVGTTGDVNGDGFADIWVGSYHYDNPEVDEGTVFVFYGNQNSGGGYNLQQRAIVDAPIAPLGKADSLSMFRLTGLGRSPYGSGSVKLEVEVKPFGAPFDGSVLQQSLKWMETGTAGAEIDELLTGLSADSQYHWRARLLYDPASMPYQLHSRWITNANNGWQQADLLLGTLSGSSVAPGEFDKSSPFHQTDDLPLSFTLDWGESENATSYVYCYDDSDDDECDGAWQPAGTNTEVTIAGLDWDTAYYWQVRANGTGFTDANNGAWWSFDTLMEPPANFGKISPLNGTSGHLLSLDLSWETSARATDYYYCVSESVDPLCGGAWVKTDTTVVHLSDLDLNKTYYWQVIANNAGGTTEANTETWWTFTTHNDTIMPVVESIEMLDPSPTEADIVQFVVTFSEAVSGVDVTDFTTQVGGLTGTFISEVSGFGTTWTITVDTGTGTGWLYLQVNDDDSILDEKLNPLGGEGSGNGAFTSSMAYLVRPFRNYLPLVRR
jgi:hypothetical protein